MHRPDNQQSIISEQLFDVKYGKYEVKSLNSDDGDQCVETIQVSPMIQVLAISDNKYNTSQNHSTVTLFVTA